MSNDIGEMDQIEEWQELGIDFQNSNIKNLMYRYSQLKSDSTASPLII
ncbi:21412_t:CDS:2 [Rhizophagus irregularis]|nr:21412_t:CDS:2 [Rhizophagus irregularis]